MIKYSKSTTGSIAKSAFVLKTSALAVAKSIAIEQKHLQMLGMKTKL